MREITINVYKVTELSKSAKERAYFDWLGESDYHWGEDNAKSLRRFEEIFPIKVTSWKYDQCSFNYRFEFTGSEELEEMSGLRLHKYLWNNYKEYLFKGKFYHKSFGKSRRSKIILANDCVLTGYCVDVDLLDPIYSFLKKPVDHLNFYDLMDDCIYSWAKSCRDDYRACSSLEYFIEESTINEWEYDENGDMI